jgi:hypothetical protein
MTDSLVDMPVLFGRITRRVVKRLTYGLRVQGKYRVMLECGHIVTRHAKKDFHTCGHCLRVFVP